MLNKPWKIGAEDSRKQGSKNAKVLDADQGIRYNIKVREAPQFQPGGDACGFNCAGLA